ncbi:YadA-like family protein [Stenotrophomonas sp. DR822]|uniref:ESPR-type extended signal peptide-containing protein n=1 Tax=Stenotrophomonas sp. DR822 TaxID=2871174 RepID=UPI001C938FD7|nr:ESPR-type extended signal peptide-containing protein [Stenotrophomonas sp. DR822]QZN80193.1 YadA-like family protein [Stenotrophomonas sp. DR822]
MNKIYRRLWSTARQCWVVASELTRSKGRSAGGARGALLLSVLVGSVSSSASAGAIFYGCGENETGFVRCAPFMGHEDATNATSTLRSSYYLSMGGGAWTDGSYSTSFGHRTSAEGDKNAVMGYGAISKQGYASVFGAHALGDGIGTIAVGHDAQAYTENSIAVGSGSRTNTGAGVSRIAIGGDAYAGSNGWTGAIALGGEARAQYDGVAIGHGAATSASGTVALGRGSIAGESNTVSVGSSSIKRRIVNVGDAQLNAASTDAVTGRQLYQLLTTTNGLISQTSTGGTVRIGAENTGPTLTISNKSGAARYLNGVRNGALNATSTDAVTGQQLNATNINVTTAQNAANTAQVTATGAKTAADSALTKANALAGLVSQVSATGNVRLGGENTGAVLDVRNKNNASRSISGVADATLSSSSTEAVTGRQLTATNSNVTTAQNTANAAQTTATAARTAADSALTKANALAGLVSQASATGTVRLGGENTGAVLDVRNKNNASRSISGVADATLSSSSTEAVTGRQLTATNSNVTTAQTTANAAQTTANAARTTADNALGRATALSGLVSQLSATGNMRLGADNAGTVVDVANKDGAKRRINNVANGVLSSTSTDVVTGQQLHATNQTVSSQGQSLALHGQQLAAHTQALAAQDQRVATNRADIDQLRTDVDNFDPDLDGVVKFSTDRLLVDMEGARVSGVAAGDVSSAASTDAVNGGQLFATNFRIGALELKDRLIDFGKEAGAAEAESGSFGVALGNGAQASIRTEGGTAVGSYSSALGKNSVALGRGSLVEEVAEGGFALGAGASVSQYSGVALGSYSEVRAAAVNSVALGANSVAEEGEVVSIGSSTLKRRVTNVARGISGENAATIVQLSESIAVFGGGAGIDSAGNVIAPTYSVQSSTQNNVGDALAVLDGAVLRSDSRVDGVEGQLRATFQQSPSISADGIGRLNLAGAQGMVLSNLADGRIAAGSRDAVTGSQLHATEQKIERNRRDLDAMQRAWSSDQNSLLSEARDGNLIDFGGARLTGVADAHLSADSSDVVRGSQLYATNLRLNSIEDNSGNTAFGWMPEEGQYPAEAGPGGIAIGKNAKASLRSEGGVAVGAWATAEGKNSVALGRASYVHEQAEEGFALGVRTQVAAKGGTALGAGSEVRSNASNSVAIGYQSIANDVDTVSFGNDWLKRRLVNVANGRNTNDAATIGQLRGALSTLGGNIDANGNVTTPGFNVQDQQQNTISEALATLDSAVVTTGSRVDRVETQLRAVFQESPSIRSDGTAQLTLAGANGMVISNVANGLIAAGSREAVNGGQLHAVQQQLNGRIDGLEQRVDGQPQARAMATASAAPTEEIMPSPEASGSPQVASAGEGASPAPQPKAKKDDSPAPTPQVDTAELEKMLARANEYTDGAISNFERRLDKMDKRFNRMAAMSSAQTAMAMNTAGLATYNRLGAGVGYAEGESAMAVGYQRVLNDKGSATFSLNGAFTNSGERSMGVGVGIGW